ncbi:MAG: hypothetical protein JNL01_06630 [Bdellovibrionales bacterium]|nr:hypothetical protein [Bdellovibrionales bacterium]
MSLSLSMDGFSEFTVNNKTRTIRRISPRPAEDSLVSSRDQVTQAKPEIDAMVISTTQKGILPLEYLLKLREPYISLRNVILDNPFKYYNPIYKRKLRHIDEKLNELDVHIHALEEPNLPSEDDLKTIILAAETRLTRCFETLSGE